MESLKWILNSFVFWAAWIVIPLIMEILPAIGSLLLLLKRKWKTVLNEAPALYPDISIIIPVYNSGDSLDACIRSIDESDYPQDRIRVFLVNNQGTDNSFQVFSQCQTRYPELHMQWMNAAQGKSRALNLALYNSKGKYIIHIDSDGVLEPSALKNMVQLFEQDSSVDCVTGAVLTDPEKVEQTPMGGLKLLRQLEFMEYVQAFLVGRNYASELNAIYTLSGAFSAFRKSAILKSWMYNTETLCEDTQMTFQMKYIQKERVHISVDSLFLTDPIEDMDKLYTQRQRWQRGSLEVSKLFMKTAELNPHRMFRDINVKTLMYDHTFAFPRMIWYLALVCLLFVGYSGNTIVMATGLLFVLYIICGYFYYASARFFLAKFPSLNRYYRSKWYLVPVLPFFNLMVFFIRLAGIINSIGTDSTWKTRTLSAEWAGFRAVVKQDVSKAAAKWKRIRDAVNDDMP